MISASKLSERIDRIAAATLGKGPNVDDIKQDSLVRAWAALEAGTVPEHLEAWLSAIIRNRAASHYRRSQRVAVCMAQDSDTAPPEATEQPADELAEREERAKERAVLARLIRRLSRPDRRVIVGALVGWPLARIASNLGVSEATIKTRACRARARLRRMAEVAA
jgi:RNA polymerase sigma factor (sigma-70 family)